MKIIKSLFFFVIPFLFIGCGDPLVDVEITSCKLNKETYKLDEDIVFTCRGCFNESHPVTGYSTLCIGFSKKIYGDDDKDLNFEIIDSGNLNLIKTKHFNDRVDNPEIENPEKSVIYYFKLYDNTVLRNYKKKIVFRANEPGTYSIDIDISAYSVSYPNENYDTYTIPFTVEAE